MTIDDYFQEIESLSYQIQFSVLSGLKILIMTLSHHDIVNGLITLAKDNPDHIQQIVQRIRFLLPLVETESELSYDESIVTYLFCLSKLDTSLAQQLGVMIHSSAGLWWSRQFIASILDIVEAPQEE